MAEARDWRVYPNPETGEVDEHELNRTLLEIGVMLRRGGGHAMLAANRVKVEPDAGVLPTERYTQSVDVRWVARTDTQPQLEDVPVAERREAPAEPAESEPETALAA